MNTQELDLRIREKVQSGLEFLSKIRNEAQTRNILVEPFIEALGYDIRNPEEVVTEFTADYGIKKGEKVDYAIKKDGKPIILIECKYHEDDLSTKTEKGQLFRYFSVVNENKLAVLTNGLIYRFFSDLEKNNQMDATPFFEFNIQEFDDTDLVQLAKFAKPVFDLDTIKETASDLMYTRAFKDALKTLFHNPSRDFIKLLASEVHQKSLTEKWLNKFNTITKKACQEFIAERVRSQLQSALENAKSDSTTVDSIIAPDQHIDSSDDFTEEERKGFYIVQAIAMQVVPADRLSMRRTKTYCGVLLDDNSRKPICRLYFNSKKQRKIGLFDGRVDEYGRKVQQNHLIENLNDIYEFSEPMRKIIHFYENNQHVLTVN